MRFCEVVQAVDYNGFICFYDEFPHLMGRIFFHEFQFFSKPDAIPSKESHKEESTNTIIIQQYPCTLSKNARI